MQGSSSRDKDFSFARLCDINAPVTLKMCSTLRIPWVRLTVRRASLEGDLPKRTYTDVLNDSSLGYEGLQSE